MFVVHIQPILSDGLERAMEIPETVMENDADSSTFEHPTGDLDFHGHIERLKESLGCFRREPAATQTVLTVSGSKLHPSKGNRVSNELTVDSIPYKPGRLFAQTFPYQSSIRSLTECHSSSSLTSAGAARH